MGFSAKQVQALRRSPDLRHIRTREAHGRELTYLEGWYALSEANRIFGFDGWSRETIESKCVLARENRGTFLVVYIARVRVTVLADGTTVIREGHGTGEGRGTSPGEVHDIALKAAETDATKRALTTFGKPFGLALYGTGKTASSAKASAPPLQPVDPGRQHSFARDDTTPIPRPSRYYGRRQDLVSRDLTSRERVPSLKVRYFRTS
jgi:DNA recombination protein Rad52